MKRLQSFVVYPCTTLLRVLHELVLTGKRQSWNTLALLLTVKPNLVHQSSRISSNAYRCDTGFQEWFSSNTLHISTNLSKQVSQSFGKNWDMGHWLPLTQILLLDFTLKISALVFFCINVIKIESLLQSMWVQNKIAKIRFTSVRVWGPS